MGSILKASQNLPEAIREYYGKILKTNDDLQTGACCDSNGMAPRHKEVLKLIHREVVEKFYGCGATLPYELEGLTVLDLGCGSGRDCYLLSKLVGPKGRVIGIDMTDEQLEVARKFVDHHTGAFGYSEPNVTFLKGYIEDLKSAGIEDNSIDLVVSNCVINLSPDKERVFSEILRVLKPGGELYFSDVFADRRIPKELSADPLLVGECLGGSLYTEDFRRLLMKLGCNDVRTVFSRRVPIDNPLIEAKVGMIGFYSNTVRVFKLPRLEDRCEDFGQVAYYKGTVPEASHMFFLDDHHTFRTGMPMPVCSNTASMITETRYAGHFDVVGDTATHYGLFDCNSGSSNGGKNSSSIDACC